MKLRLKSNSIRIRLTKTEVSTLVDTGYLEEKTPFAHSTLEYRLQTTFADEIYAALNTNKIIVFIPEILIKGWPESDLIGFTGKMTLANEEVLHIKIEKDFTCLDETTEDQSDNYANPKTPAKIE